MNIQRILRACDHTLLKPEATWEDVRRLCTEARDFSTASVCLAPVFVSRAREYLQGEVPICTVIGFPHGNRTTQTKIFEAQNAVKNGADELDAVISIGELKAGNHIYVRDEIAALKEVCGERILKVIIETALLSEEEKITMCHLVTEAGADFIKTSTGFASGGATIADVQLMAVHIGKNVRIKAAGGIATLEDAELFLEAGASRLGTSRIVRLVKERYARKAEA